MDGDRYQVNPLDGPAQMAEWVRSIERRLGALEGAPMVGQNLVSYDDDGHPLVHVGVLPDGSYGLLISSAIGGWDLTKMTADGWAAPHLMAMGWKTTDTIAVTSPTFISTYAATFASALGPGVELWIPWATDAATTGELQVSVNGGGTTGSIALPAGSLAGHFVRWLHGAPIGTGPLEFRVNARRTGGTGNVWVYPSQAYVQDPSICSAGGTWL